MIEEKADDVRLEGLGGGVGRQAWEVEVLEERAWHGWKARDETKEYGILERQHGGMWY